MAVKFGVSTDPLGIGDGTKYEPLSLSTRSMGENKRFRDRTGGFIEEHYWDKYSSYTVKYLVLAGGTTFNRGDTFSGTCIIDNATLDENNEDGATLTVEYHVN